MDDLTKEIIDRYRTPVPAHKLGGYIKKSKKVIDHPQNMTRLNGFNREYHFIELYAKSLGMVTEIALREENVSRNRYANVLPYDMTRVVLNDGGESDYINANWCPDIIGNDRRFIVTQGPLDNTIYDFWRMVVLYNSKTIIMLTNLAEDGKQKCSQYWPDEDEPLVLEDITITIIINNEQSSFTHRILRVQQGEIDYELDHFHYTRWPDHRVPGSSTTFLNFVSESYNMCPHNPMIVHCSAGIGRTGTYVTISSHIERINNLILEGELITDISVFETILTEREHRMGMVQNADQLTFCYNAIYRDLKSKTEKKTRILSSSRKREDPQYFINKI